MGGVRVGANRGRAGNIFRKRSRWLRSQNFLAPSGPGPRSQAREPEGAGSLRAGPGGPGPGGKGLGRAGQGNLTNSRGVRRGRPGRPPATPCRTVFNVKRRAWSRKRAAGGSGKWAQATYSQSRPGKSYQFSRRVRRGRPWRQTGAACRRLPPAGPFLTLKGARGAKSGRQGVAASGRKQL